MDFEDSVSSSSLSSCLFSCRIVDISSILVTPIKGLDVCYSEISGSSVKKVPIIRIFGSTPVGQKCCLHVHGTFPYLYVPYNNTSENPSDRYMIQLGQSIDHALTVSLGSSAEEHHVFKIIIVTGIPFYGYHSTEKLFLKIYLYNPANIKRLSDLLLSGAVMNTVFQPHESHIPFPLQFMIDYNLYGMNFINTSAIRFRPKEDISVICHHSSTSSHDGPPFSHDGPPSSPSMSILSTSSVLLQPSQRTWNMNTLSDDMFINETRVSSSELEADILAADILNREEIELSSGSFPGLTALWEEEQTRRETLGIETPLSQPPSPDRFCNIIHPAEERFQEQLKQMIESHITASIEPVEEDSISASPHSSSYSYPLSQSCNVSIHEPLKSPVKDGGKKEDVIVIVDEKLLQKKIEINKKLSAATFDTNDEELLDTLAELADQPSQLVDDESSSPPPASHFILSQVLSLTKRNSENSSGTSRVCTERSNRDFSSPLGSDYDLFGDSHGRDQLIRSPSSVSAGSHYSYLDDTIPCNQYAAEKNKELSVTVDESCDTRTSPFNTNSFNRSPTPLVLSNEMDVSISHSLQFPTRQLSYKEKKELVRICSDMSNMEEKDNESDNNSDDDSADEEIESLLMTDILWNDEQEESVLETDKDDFNNNLPQFDGPKGDGRKKKKGRMSLKRKNSSRTNPSSDQTSSTISVHQTGQTSSIHMTDINGQKKQVKRALSGSLIPLVRKLSKEDTERYFQQTPQVSPFTTDCDVYKMEDTQSSTIGITCKHSSTPTKQKRKHSDPVIVTSNKKHINVSNSPPSLSSSPPSLIVSGSPLSLSASSSPPSLSSSPPSLIVSSSPPSLIVSPEETMNIEIKQKDSNEDIINDFTLIYSETESESEPCESEPCESEPPCESESLLNIQSTAKVTETVHWGSNSGGNNKIKDNDNKMDNLLLYGVTSYDGSSTVIDNVNNKHDDYHEDTINDFALVYSTSETDGSESEPGESVDNYTPLQETITHTAKVKETVHWTDYVERQDSLSCSDPRPCIITPNIPPPSVDQLMKTSSLYNIPATRHTKPFYSNPHDVQQPRNFGGTLFWIPSTMSYDLKEFSPSYSIDTTTNSSCSNYNHWSTVLTTYNGSNTTHPTCYPEIRNGKTRNMLYTATDHKKDIKTRSLLASNTSCVITPIKAPPDPQTLQRWTKEHQHLTEDLCVNKGISRSLSDSSSLLEGPSLNNTYGFKLTPDNNQTIGCSHFEYVTLMSIEIHVQTRLGLKPDPEWDPVLVVCYSIQNDWESSIQRTGLIVIDLNVCNDISSPVKHKPMKSSPVKKSPMKSSPIKKSPMKSPKKQEAIKQSRLNSTTQFKNFTNIFINDPIPSTATNNTITNNGNNQFLQGSSLSPDLNIIYVNNESDLFEELIKLVLRVDPDFLIGYEVEMSSLGYLKDRASYLGINLFNKLARIVTPLSKRAPPTTNNSSGKISEPRIIGRIVLNLWRLIKHELTLTSYSFENFSFHALQKRVAQFTHQTLTEWYQTSLYRHRVIDYYMIRCHGNLEMIDKFNLIGRTSEMARLYGIEFQCCLSRGTQYRVESMMLRLAKPANYIAASPSVYQRAKMAAPECLPLILEPESKFYTDPVLVLDFQSLYPSMIIGYNYCYSTCLGRVKNLSVDGDYKFGTCSLSVSAAELKRLKPNVTISPNGIVFLKSSVREGILPRMLKEILNTRIMVKQSMKLHKNNKKLLKMLDARQLCLKLIANVTYGYTGASYSGRMPCVEVADSIVRKGRETLERAIDLIHSNSQWRARVVYGDTDSVFVLLKGVTKDEAFRIGNEMCQAITEDNPKPMKLKFEKVYLPCLLQTKKRYVGYSYESPDQKEPIYDAKGIETVRRDGCPAVGKILEKCLRLLFSSRDLTTVKSYFQHQCTKIMKGQVSLQDFTIAKEYRGREGYRPGACVPSLELSRQGLSVDRRSEPRAGERVPYVIVYGGPGLPLIELVRRPDELLTNVSLRLNSVYYITKQILPALDRGFVLLGVNVFQWYNELPKIKQSSLSTTYPVPHQSHKNTIGQYFPSIHCLICNELTREYVCKKCQLNPSKVTVQLSTDIRRAQDKYYTISKLCENCCGSSDSKYFLECVSMDCPVQYIRQSCLKRFYGKDANQYLLHQINEHS